MMAQIHGFVALACSALLLIHCGSTTKKDVDSDTSDAGPSISNASNQTSGSGGSTGQGVTATVSASSVTGTGGTAMTDCPSFEPAVGSMCTQQGQVCAFENCRAPAFNDDHVLTCIEGAWTMTDVTACEFKSCPAALPVVGEVCDERIAPESCVFVDACGISVEVVCAAGAWQRAGANNDEAPADPALPAPVCPAYPPYLGDPCCPMTTPEVCAYSATASGAGGAAGASFLIDPAGSTSSGNGGAEEPPPTLTCAVCTPGMRWDYCPE